MRSALLYAVFVMLLFGTMSKPSFATTINVYGKLFSEAGPQANPDPFVHWGKQTFTGPAPTLNNVVSEAITEYASSTTTYNYSVDSFSKKASFLANFSHGVSSMPESWADSYCWLAFTVTESVNYAIDGNYSLVGSGKVAQDVSLMNSLGAILFSDRQKSLSTINEYFTIDGAGGDNLNSYTGSASGVLAPGTYFFSYKYSLSNAGPAALTSGFAELTLDPSPASAVPEPGTIALLGSGLAGLAFITRRRTKR